MTTNNNLKSFSLDKVKLLDEYSINAHQKELEYLLSFKADKLIAGFYETKGLKGKDTKYSGWEDTEIKGHTLGHYLVALSQAYLNSYSNKILELIDYIIDELNICQHDNGFLFASNEEIFDRVENRQPAWVPWYTMHKILSGLVAVYKATSNQKAYEIADNLGNWIFERTSKWSPELKELVLSVEYGGMNDVLYDLYSISKSEKHLFAAHQFDELDLFNAMANNQDILDGRHANTTIPKILGGLKRYFVLDDKRDSKDILYLEAAINFWDMVVDNHSYITGGNSEWEHFGTPNILDKERTNCNCETCNSYNMLKLSKLLFEITGHKKYADFYERTQINAILASQNPTTGMTTYFQPMATGYFKVYSSAFDKFWCCTGTGMESFTKLNDGIYFYKQDTIYVNRYISSNLDWTDKNLNLMQESHFPNKNQITFTVHTPLNNIELNIALRIPTWIKGKPLVKINNESIHYEIHNEYIILDNDFKNFDKITLELEATLWYHRLPDNKNSVAFAYGPNVLCATTGDEEFNTVQTGVMVNIPTKTTDIKDFLILEDESLDSWLENINTNLVKRDNSLIFDLKNTDDNLVFSPYYSEHSNRYGIYWSFILKDSPEMQNHILEKKNKKRFDDSIIDMIPVGNDQYELVHNIKGKHTDVGGIEGHRCRVIREHGWFSYDFTLDKDTSYYLGTTYYNMDIGKTFHIYIDNELAIKYTLSNKNKERFFTDEHLIPKRFIEGKGKINIRYEHEIANTINSIWDLIYIRREYNSNTNLKSSSYKNGELKITPEDPNALVYLDGILIDDSLSRIVDITKEDNLLITIVAENRIDKKDYTITL